MTDAPRRVIIAELQAKDADRFIRALEGAERSMEDLGKEADKTADNLKKTEQATESYDKSAGAAIKTVMALGQAFIGMRILQQVRDLIVSTVTATTDLARQVRDLSLATGTAPEQASRLLQVLDDYEISAQQMGTAMRTLRQFGVVPTVDSLADLSDQFLALPSGIDRTNFLMERFGRTGLQMANLLAQGGDRIRSMGAAVDEALIFTQDAIDATERYRLGVDTLNDRVLALKVSIGERLIPVLTQWIESSLAQAEAQRQLGMSLQQAGPEGWALVRQIEERMQAENAARLSTLGLADATEELAGGLGSVERAGREAGGAVHGAAVAFDTANTSLGSLISTFRDRVRWVTGGGLQIEQAAQQVMDAVRSGAITPEQADEMLRPIHAAALGLQTEIGMIRPNDAVRQYVEEYGGSWNNAQRAIQDARQEIENIPDEVRTEIMARVHWSFAQGERLGRERVQPYQTNWASGGAFAVGGRAGRDQNRVGFNASRGEVVQVLTAAQQRALAQASHGAMPLALSGAGGSTMYDQRSMLAGGRIIIQDQPSRQYIRQLIDEYFGG